MNYLRFFSKHLWVLSRLSVKYLGAVKHLGVLGLSLGSVAVGLSVSTAAAAETMRVSWYGPGFDGSYTANGEIFSRYDYTAAHPDWPFGTILLLTNLDTGENVTVRVNDRSGGALDISEQAARDLGTYEEGITSVNVEVLRWGE